MDFVSRLKKFLDAKQIPVTQFADNCRIPRPTLSQLLNGRNKKVSDEVIGKIHEAYPSLSVMWLMFGEGSMEAGTPTHASQSERPAPREYTYPLPSESTGGYNFDDMFTSDDPLIPDNSSRQPVEPAAQTTIQFPEATLAPNINEIDREGNHTSPSQGDDHNDQSTDESAFTSTESSTLRDLTFSKLQNNAGSKKRIVNIIVYYDDNSFEAFVPENR